MKVSALSEHFFEIANTYSDSLGASESKAQKTKSGVSLVMRLGTLRLEIVFRTKGGSLCCPCTLFCRVYPSIDSERYMPMCDLVNDGFVCSVFPYIETVQRLDDCFAALTSAIDRSLPDLKTICSDDNTVKSLFKRQEAEFIKQFKLKSKHTTFDSEQTRQAYFTLLCDIYEGSVFLPTMTTDEAYLSFLKGKRKKAIKLFKNKKRPTYYEAALANAIADMPPEFVPISDDCFARKYYQKALFGRIPLAFFTVLPFMSIFFCGIYALLCRFLSFGAVISLELPTLIGIPAFALIPSALAAVFFYDRATAFIRPRANLKLIEFTDITISDKLRTLCRIVFTIVMALETVFAMMLSCTALRFYPTYVTEPANALQMPWDDTVKYDYKNITGVYHYAGMTNAYGEYIEKEGYLITFKDGYKVRLDGYGNIKMQNKAIEYLKDYYDEITEVSDLTALN